ncbi:hypothetical protein PybrP1_005335 [[Pythium] brassicae (nom. inval.)]|nr:hypothetical protein PybrP1_005335 [[Pythium] brassicae (nom. inval.)]
MSEVPITFERARGRADPIAPTQLSARPPASNGTSRSSRSDADPLQDYRISAAEAARLPVRGVLRGKVLYASNLPSLTSPSGMFAVKLRVVPPRAFAKVAFVEAGESATATASNLMLRCKSTLATTSVAQPSCNPTWNVEGCDDAMDGDFQMQLAPAPVKTAPAASMKQAPAWLQLRGDLLFSVYSASDGESDDNNHGGGGARNRRSVHDFIGQAVLSLPDVLREALFTSPTLTRHLPLQSRQGKPLMANIGRDALDNKGVGGTQKATPGPEIAVSLEFEPTYSENKFAKQIDQQNAAFAKRIEWQHERRTRLAEHAKAQAKSSQPVPQHGTMKRGHKASSSINRSRLQQQIHDENRAMEKRLHAIVLKGSDRTHDRADAKRGAAGDVRFDAPDKDKLLACDQRQQRLREQDFLAARAQAAYRKQSAVAEEVAALQADVAELRAQVAAAKASVNRLDILTNKDQHLCKCLRSAADASAVGSAGAAVGSSTKATKRSTPTDEDAGASSGADASRQRKELELLRNEAAALNADTQRRGQELRACNERAQELDDEIRRLGAQLRFVQDKQAFERRLTGKAGAAEQQPLLLAQDMKRRQQRLELSRDEEEHWQLFQAQQELTQLQIAVQVLKDRQDAPRATGAAPAGPTVTPTTTAACAYLEKKIARQTQKLEQLESEQRQCQHAYEALAASGEHEALRKQVHELQQTLFLCQAQQKQLVAAQRRAALAGERLAVELQKQAFEQQTETDVVLKRRR